jgi:hypothetical protein
VQGEVLPIRRLYSNEGRFYHLRLAMNEATHAQTRVWIRDRDSLGNIVDHVLIDAAYRIWERARYTVIRFLGEDAEAGEILEGAVDAASRVLASGRQIHALDRYLLRSVAREAIRRNRRNGRVVYLDTVDLERTAAPVCLDLDRPLDERKLLDLLRACMDEQTRRMYDLRVLEKNWKYLGTVLGYADAHSTEVQFHKGMKRALDRFRAHHESRFKPMSGRK